MIYCILGHSASGKSTIQRELNSFIPTITTYTTRPMRDNEKEGKDYYFLTNKEFLKRKEKGFFIECYLVKDNNWWYGVSLDGIDYKNKDFTLVITPSGYEILKNRIGSEFLKSYYICLTEHERVIRMAKRKDKIEEMFRRIKKDRVDFYGFHKIADVTLRSTNSQQNGKLILKHIKEGSF